ncbi:MAG TPA: S16 family serine protease, partial [bacterium]
KVLAAHRAGVRTVILPKENEKDLNEIPANVRRKLHMVLVEHMDEVLSEALAPTPAVGLPVPPPVAPQPTIRPQPSQQMLS